MVIGLLAVLALTVRLPVLVLGPGGAVSVAERVSFVGRDEDPIDGRLLFTTVAISEPTVIQALGAWLDGDEDIVDRDLVIPEGVEPTRYFEAQRDVFVESGQVAAAVGLRAAGLDVDVVGEGAEVIAVAPDAPAGPVLRPGDVITAIEQQPVALASDLVRAVGGRGPGDTVTLTVRREGQTLTPQVTLGRIDPMGAAGLGVAVRTLNQKIDLPFEVAVDAEQIGGPSAGLMIALTVYEMATEADAISGETVAGTGTIDLGGTVGPVGGVAQKVVAAAHAGAEYFLVPPAEVATALLAAPEGLRIIPVGTFDDALDELERISS